MLTRLALTSPPWFAGQFARSAHGVWEYAGVPSGCGVPVPPAKWSPSTVVTANSVLRWSIPSRLSRAKNAANASS